jgi:hypothetical protein
VWKKGRGPIEKIDAATGEIMCLVEVPATYKVMDTPPTTRKVTVPAEYKTVKVQKLVTPAEQKRIPIPEAYDTVTKTIKVTEGRMEWRPILCETNLTPDVVTSIQRALLKRGHNPGHIDGKIGARTKAAVESFQKEKGLPQAGLTIDTIRQLGVKIGTDL